MSCFFSSLITLYSFCILDIFVPKQFCVCNFIHGFLLSKVSCYLDDYRLLIATISKGLEHITINQLKISLIYTMSINFVCAHVQGVYVENFLAQSLSKNLTKDLFRTSLYIYICPCGWISLRKKKCRREVKVVEWWLTS